MSDGLQAFVDAARSFCAFMERPPGDNDVEEAAQRLAALYAAGLSLPPTDPEADLKNADCPECAENPPPRNLGAQYYTETAAPLALTAHDDVIGDLDDDLLDVYRDVKAGLLSFDAGHRRSAGWHWRFTLESHWGDHAVDALRALHRLVVENRHATVR